MKQDSKKRPVLKKLKIYFILIIIALWGIASFKLYDVLKQNNILDDISFLKSNSDLKIQEEIFSEELEENAPESPDLIFFKEYINKLYGEYYDIINVRIISYIPEDEEFTNNDKFYFATIEKKLKFSSVFQLPFVSGMKKAIDEISSTSKNSSIKKKAKDIYNKKTNELKKYIGEKQIEHNIFKISFAEMNNFENIKIEIATYHDKISADCLAPPPFETLVNAGYEYIKTSLKYKSKKIKYDNDSAICYADKHSSNPFKTGINKQLWNTKYKPYENDCANFVSQCLYAGGVLKTSKWFPDSFYWIRTGSPKYPNISGVTNYMQKLNNFYLTNYSAVSAGGFICLINESHTVFITSNDSITILFNGHTNDRKRVSFPHLDSTKTMYLTPNN